LDAVTANTSEAGTVTVRYGDGQGGFESRQDFETDKYPHDVAAGDLNQDGIVDLVTANQTAFNNLVSVLLGTSNGGFNTHQDYFLDPEGVGMEVALADFNGDGNLDAAVAKYQVDDGIAILLGDGTGAFTSLAEFSTGIQVWSVQAADLNNDGKSDVICTNAELEGGELLVLLGDGNGGLGEPLRSPVPGYPEFVKVADLNSDGNLDAIVVGLVGDAVTIFLGMGTGGLEKRQEILTKGLEDSPAPKSVAVADFNGDSFPDIAVTALPGSLLFFPGDGSGSFDVTLLETYPTGPGGFSIATGDVNGDGKLDIVTSSGDVSFVPNTMSVLLAK